MGAGSIKKATLKGGRVVYRVRYDGPLRADGTRVQRCETRRTKKEAEALLAQRLGDVSRGAFVEPSREPLAAYLERWVADAGAAWSEATVYSYAGVLRGRVIPRLGAVPLGKLTVLHVQGLVRELLEAAYAPSTVRLTHTILHAALAQAVRWRLIPFNPGDGVTLPAAHKAEPAAWSAAAARAFLAATDGDELAPLWRLALDTGMRLGELLALRWDDIDRVAGVVSVRRTLTRTRRGTWVIGTVPKTSKSRRAIPIAPATLALLRVHGARQAERRLRQGPAWHDEGLVFDRGDGHPYLEARIQDAFGRAVAAAAAPPLTVHGLRHTCATLLLRANVHPKVVQERLGHASIAITMDRYAHVTPDVREVAAAAIAEQLGDGDGPAAEAAGDRS